MRSEANFGGSPINTAQIGLFVILPAISVVLGALIAVARTPGATIRSAIQHFAAGVVFSVVAVELLPDLTKTHSIPEVIGGFIAGVIILMLIRAKFDEGQQRAELPGSEAPTRPMPTGMLTGIGIDILLDGLLLGMGMSLGAKEGMLLAGALSIEVLSLGLALSADLRNRGFSRAKTVAISAGLGSLSIVGAVGGYFSLSSASGHVLASVLSFGCAALLFLVTEELLVKAHEVPENAFTTSSFFGGFLLFMVLGMAL